MWVQACLSTFKTFVQAWPDLEKTRQRSRQVFWETCLGSLNMDQHQTFCLVGTLWRTWLFTCALAQRHSKTEPSKPERRSTAPETTRLGYPQSARGGYGGYAAASTAHLDVQRHLEATKRERRCRPFSKPGNMWQTGQQKGLVCCLNM